MTSKYDPILDEIYRERDEHAARFNYDLEAIWRDLKDRERKSSRPVIAPDDRKPRQSR